MECIYCGNAVIEGRWALGYQYCLDKYCVRKAIDERQSEYRVILMPKQNFAIVHKDSPDLLIGKSSGR
jgi:hypothetical protein